MQQLAAPGVDDGLAGQDAADALLDIVQIEQVLGGVGQVGVEVLAVGEGQRPGSHGQ